jgi:hypothetical protein
MTTLISWTLIGGLLVFGLGLVSAISARRQRSVRVRSVSQAVVYVPSPQPDAAPVKPAGDTAALNQGTPLSVSATMGVGQQT